MLRACVLAAGLFLATSAPGSAAVWNPQQATPVNIPDPGCSLIGSDGWPVCYYHYAPSVVQMSSSQRYVYYCGNDSSLSGTQNRIGDNLMVSAGSLNASGQWVYSQPTSMVGALSPGALNWVFQNTCDPELLQGQFRFTPPGEGQQTFQYILLFTGEVPSGQNEIGVAFSNSPTGPWIVDSQPLVTLQDDGVPASNTWGIGQPSATSIDGAGNFMLFYTGQDGFEMREVDLANADSPQLSAPVVESTSGLSSEFSWVHNASVVYDPDTERFIASYDIGDSPAGSPVQTGIAVASISSAAMWLGTGGWQLNGTVGQCVSGEQLNSNSGIVRTPYGTLAQSGQVDVMWAVSTAEGAPWYQMVEADAPLALQSDSQPTMTSDNAHDLVLVAHDWGQDSYPSANPPCIARTWVSTSDGHGSFGAWTDLGASPAGQPVAAKNSDGRIQLFARAADGSVWTNAQTSPGGSFGGWSSLPAVSGTTHPVAFKNEDGRLTVLALDANDHLMEISQVSPGGAFAAHWTDTGAAPANPPSVGVDSDGAVTLVAHAASSAGGGLWVDQQQGPNGPLGGWYVLDGNKSFDGDVPTLVPDQAGALELFGLTNGANVWDSTQSPPEGTFGPFSEFGASPAGDPTGVLRPDGQIQLVARAADGSIWTNVETGPDSGAFFGWGSLDGTAQSQPVLGVDADGRLVLAYQDTSGNIRELTESSPGSGLAPGAGQVIP